MIINGWSSLETSRSQGSNENNKLLIKNVVCNIAGGLKNPFWEKDLKILKLNYVDRV